MPSVAFIGLGSMGLPMARNLVQAGFDVRVWNRTAAKAWDLPGARPAPTPAAAADGAEFAVSMLADDAAVEAAALGPDGILAGLRKGAIHVGASTVSVALCRRLAEAHAGKGVGYVAAPVFGRPDAAAARQLWIVLAAPQPTSSAARPCLPRWGRALSPWAPLPRRASPSCSATS